jgi:hypothetical protein
MPQYTPMLHSNKEKQDKTKEKKYRNGNSYQNVEFAIK